jgi:2'-5' RNA ligase
MAPESPTSIRAFIAIPINEETRCALATAQTSLKKANAHVAWVAPANIHVSLAFLGDIVSDLIPPIEQVLDATAAVTTPFAFDVADLGTFGRPDSPRVIWAGVRNPAPIQRLQGKIADGLRSLQIPQETREFVPHLTLGRVKSSRNRGELTKAIRTAERRSFGRVEATRVLFMRSILKPTGSEYSIVHEAPFSK